MQALVDTFKGIDFTPFKGVSYTKWLGELIGEIVENMPKYVALNKVFEDLEKAGYILEYDYGFCRICHPYARGQAGIKECQIKAKDIINGAGWFHNAPLNNRKKYVGQVYLNCRRDLLTM